MHDETGPPVHGEPWRGTPRWVKVFGTITLVVALLFVILKVAGGGRHGPGRHMPRSDTSQQSGR